MGQRGVRLSFIDRAQPSTRPSKPTMWMILAAAIVIGVGMGAVMVVLAELLDRTFHSVEEAVDQLKLPVLGAVNVIVTPAAKMRQRILHWGIYPLATVLLVVTLGVSGYVAYQSIYYPRQASTPSTLIDSLLGHGS
jgi:hypothetical protein